MNSVLFVATIDPDAPRRLDWADFATRAAEKIQPGPDAMRLAENVWLLRLEKSLAPSRMADFSGRRESIILRDSGI